MEEDTIQNQAISELRYEDKQSAIRDAKGFIRAIIENQRIIARAQIDIGLLKEKLASIKVVEIQI